MAYIFNFMNWRMLVCASANTDFSGQCYCKVDLEVVQNDVEEYHMPPL
jgi:hypothetical protein